MKKTPGRESPTPRAHPQRQSTQVIARAASSLRAMEGERTGLSLGQIAQRVGLARSTVQRIVDSLSAEQLLIAATPSAGVRLGPALVRLATSASLDIEQITRPIMAGLARDTGETIDLSVLGQCAVFVDSREPTACGPYRRWRGLPLHCTANGEALLSLSRTSGLTGCCARAAQTASRRGPGVWSEIESCRRTGLAFDLEEHTEGICAVGAAFSDPVGRPMALSIPVPVTRFKRHRQELGAALLRARGQILDALGPPVPAATR